MAVPTITSIDPTTGSTKGLNVVQIVGTGFRLPPAPPAEGYVGGDAQRTVSVKFEGVEALWAEAATDELVMANVPQWAGDYEAIPLKLDVRVANLDDAGVEIPGENVTLVDGYTIKRPDMAIECTLKRVCREAIAIFRRHLLKNTHMTMSRDFDENPANLERVVADVPVVYLIGPDLPLNRFNSINREDCVEDPADPLRYIRKSPPVVTDLTWEIRIYAKGSTHTLALEQALLLMFRDVVELTTNEGTYDFIMPFNRYPTTVNVPNQEDVYSVRSAFTIRGVHIDEESGTIIERGSEVFANDGEPLVDIQAL